MTAGRPWPGCHANGPYRQATKPPTLPFAVYSTRNPARRSARSQSRSFPPGPSGPTVGVPSSYQVTAARGYAAPATTTATNPVPVACPFGEVTASRQPGPCEHETDRGDQNVIC